MADRYVAIEEGPEDSKSEVRKIVNCKISFISHITSSFHVTIASSRRNLYLCLRGMLCNCAVECIFLWWVFSLFMSLKILFYFLILNFLKFNQVYCIKKLINAFKFKFNALKKLSWQWYDFWRRHAL